MTLVRRKKPIEKLDLFRKLVGFTEVRTVDGNLEVEAVIWKVRETSNSLMFLFSDGVVNTLRLEEHSAFWTPNEKQTSVVSDPSDLKHYIKKKVVSRYYKKVGKSNEIKT